MITSDDCYKKYGNPDQENACMTTWSLPANLIQGKIPKRIFCNKDMITPLTLAFVQLITTGAINELKTFDGCFCIREIRGVTGKMSLHSWGVAIDFNASENGLGQVPKLSAEFVKCFTGTGFDWGGNFKRKDGMHFQLAKI